MPPAPLPLLGTFHELSLAVADVRAAVELCERLGFVQAPTTDAFTHPYGALSDGRLCIGLHGRAAPSPTLTFVRPGVAGLVAAYADAGIDLVTCRVGDEEFHELGFADPAGHAVAVLEARTYSPVPRGGTRDSLCGRFEEISLPAADLAAARAFWETLGFVAADTDAASWPHVALTSDFLDLSFHAPAVCPRPMLVFRDAALAERVARIEALGLATRPAPRGGGAGVELAGPGGTALLVLGADD